MKWSFAHPAPACSALSSQITRTIDSRALDPYKPRTSGPKTRNDGWIAVRKSNALAEMQTQEGPHTAVLNK
ncbi:hypothetical protein GCM10007920_40500 [Ciceribacter naphthalenivorans]|uniref:Uncharacterized protein n=2 Tax=Alphaproteobacteria TaxID=28211 RepID=A0A512HDR2_9HYPH|nr:hypothetical protein RNA01_05240 [Ciceribacter naphthalenivorans]GLR24256.1 hypothetical protein GCM10007920_40500 [Ciceribacter naphthalenivorans]GLT07112.1 hypothetical protein GCM10007926_40500 [Sphingomonas psychrolutea]